MRGKRQESSTGIYHVMSRGNNRMNIFHESKDYRQYLTELKEKMEKHDCSVFAWCLMTNHVHLLVKAEYEKLSELMKEINSGYAGWYNFKYGHVGHVFQSRFKSVAVESERQLMVVFRYILRNPIKAHMVDQFGRYRWSCYHAYVDRDDEITSCEMMLDVFGGIMPLMEFININSLDAALELMDHGDWMDEEERTELLCSYLLLESGCRDLDEFKALPVTVQVSYCQKAKESGFTYTLCQKVTGLSEYIMRSRRSGDGSRSHSGNGDSPQNLNKDGDSPQRVDHVTGDAGVIVS